MREKPWDRHLYSKPSQQPPRCRPAPGDRIERDKAVEGHKERPRRCGKILTTAAARNHHHGIRPSGFRRAQIRPSSPPQAAAPPAGPPVSTPRTQTRRSAPPAPPQRLPAPCPPVDASPPREGSPSGHAIHTRRQGRPGAASGSGQGRAAVALCLARVGGPPELPARAAREGFGGVGVERRRRDSGGGSKL